MKKFYLLLVLVSVFGFSQNQDHIVYNKMGLFANVDANIGLDLVILLRNNKNKSQEEIAKQPPGKFNYGFSSTIGFQPFKWFVLGSGFRYSYIDPNYHLLYFLVQPQIILNSVQEDDPLFIKIFVGKQINHSVNNHATFVGLSFGKAEVLNPRFSHYLQVNLEVQNIEKEGIPFVGISYGIQVYSNKNYLQYK